MNPDEHDRLLREILSHPGLARVRHDSLERGIGALRARRQRRRWTTAATAALTLLLAAFVAVERRPSEPAAPAANVSSRPAAPARRDRVSVKVNTISDEELFALFPRAAVALVGEPGNQKLVFLRPAEAAAHD